MYLKEQKKKEVWRFLIKGSTWMKVLWIIGANAKLDSVGYKLDNGPSYGIVEKEAGR